MGINTWQVLRQIKFLLQQRAWTGSAVRVFGQQSVIVTVAPDEQAVARLVPPIVMLRPLDASVDPQHGEEPDLIHQTVGVRLVVVVPGDALGENALIGANRVGQTDSRGRGLLEVEEELFAAIELLNGIDGVKIQNRATGAALATIEEGTGNYICYRDYQFLAVVTADRFYHPASRLAASTPGGGAVSLTWLLPPARYDRFRVILRRAAGSTPPSSPTGGTGVVLSGDLAISVVDTPGAGTFSYALFGSYDETNSPASVEQRYSAAVTKTVTAV